MADQELTAEESARQKKEIKEERKRLKQEEKKQRQDIKKRAKEISKRESELADEEESGGASSFVVTTVIVLVWIAILVFLIKLDVGGFGSEILAPLLKDVPVINKILPDSVITPAETEEESYGGYTNLKEAVEYIKVLELELEHAQTVNNNYTEELTRLQSEVNRLSEFEQMQVEFQRIKEQFYEEVIYADKGPGAEEYKKFYESIDPTTSEALYKQVINRLATDQEIKDYVSIYSQMKPKACAAIFDEMTANNSKMLAEILLEMEPDAAAKILAAMQAGNAAILTKIMYPEG